MIILGIDPGLATTGYGVIRIDPKDFHKFDQKDNGFELIDFGCLVTEKEKKEQHRLCDLHQSTLSLIQKFNPDIVTIERLFFFRNAKTIIPVGQARGVVILAVTQLNVPIMEYAPLQIKSKIVGYGRAKKQEVKKKVKEILHKKKLKLRKTEKSRDGHHLDDAVDALAVAICHSYILGQAERDSGASVKKTEVNKVSSKSNKKTIKKKK